MNTNDKASMITTVIPTYRRPQLLQRAVKSALEQKGVSVSVRVFDNASGDETADVIARLAVDYPRLHYHCHESNLGAAANFEFGLRSVDTPFFSILSDDDYLLPGFYKQALNDLEQNPAAMFWAGLTLNVDEQGVIWDARIDRWPRDGLFAPPEGLMAMMHGLAPTWTGIVFRREILDHVGFPDKETLGPADLDFSLKAASAHSFVLRKHPSAVFTLNSESFSATQPLSCFWPGWQKMFRNLEMNTEIDEGSKAIALKALHADAKRMLFRRGANALAAGRYAFVRDTAEALRAQYGKRRQPWLLNTLASSCERFPFVQRFYTGAYRAVEQRLVKSRKGLQQRFGHLLIRS
jgi:glycosyltransferase involved in cell wall biosynthesis